MKFLLIALLFLNAGAEVSPKVEPPKAAGAPRTAEAAFDRFVEVTDMAKAVDKTNELQLDALIQQNPGMKAIEPELRKFFSDNVSWKAVSGDIRKVYLAEFTPSEMDDIANFYGTPTGKKAMQKMPGMMVKVQQIALKVLQTKMPAFMESVKDKLPKPKQ